jgi:YVTN family beta-propeller protein
VLTLIPVPKNPHGCNVTPDGKYVLASGKLSPTVSVIDAKTLKVIAEPEVGLGPLPYDVRWSRQRLHFTIRGFADREVEHRKSG